MLNWVSIGPVWFGLKWCILCKGFFIWFGLKWYHGKYLQCFEDLYDVVCVEMVHPLWGSAIWLRWSFFVVGPWKCRTRTTIQTHSTSMMHLHRQATVYCRGWTTLSKVNLHRHDTLHPQVAHALSRLHNANRVRDMCSAFDNKKLWDDNFKFRAFRHILDILWCGPSLYKN